MSEAGNKLVLVQWLNGKTHWLYVKVEEKPHPFHYKATRLSDGTVEVKEFIIDKNDHEAAVALRKFKPNVATYWYREARTLSKAEVENMTIDEANKTDMGGST